MFNRQFEVCIIGKNRASSGTVLLGFAPVKMRISSWVVREMDENAV